MRSRINPLTAILAGLLLAGLALTGCSDSEETLVAPTPKVDDDLIGAWLSIGYDPETRVHSYERVAELDGDRSGYHFLGDGRLLHRSHGWCGTPPLSYFNQQGRWAAVAEDHVDLIFANWPFDSQMEIVAVDETTLQLRWVDPE